MRPQCFPRYQASLSVRQQKRIRSRQQPNHRRIDYVSISKNPIRAVGRAGLERQQQQKMHFKSRGAPHAPRHSQHPRKNPLKVSLLLVQGPLCYESFSLRCSSSTNKALLQGCDFGILATHPATALGCCCVAAKHFPALSTGGSGSGAGKPKPLACRRVKRPLRH